MRLEMHLRKWLNNKGDIMVITDIINAVKTGQLDDKLTALYGAEALASQKVRYEEVLLKAKDLLGDKEAHIFSAPGRTEVGGNHTDHQLGRVVAASIDLDVIAVVVPTDDFIVTYHAKGFSVSPVDLHNLEINEAEKNTTESLIRGIAAGFTKKGYKVGGFKAYSESNVLSGGGMSSSAAFEVLIGTIFSHLYNDAMISSEEIAKIGQFSENVYFMKASGLLDQMACSVGSFAAMDFANKENPQVTSIPFNPADYGYDLILTDVKASHADLSDEYSAVPHEMKAVAKLFGKEVLSQISLNELLENTAKIRKEVGDRAFLRAYHFLNETSRAKLQAEALKKNDIKTFLHLVNESGHSSYMYLQNVLIPGDSHNQALAIALALSESVLGDDGACRVHGGGFAGTIQAYVPHAKTSEYIALMESTFGKDCCYKLRIRDCGGICVI